MLNVLRVGEVLLLDVVAAVVLFKVVDLVLVLVVAVVAGPEAEVGQAEAARGAYRVFGKRNGAGAVGVVEFEHLLHDVVFLLLRDVACGFVEQAVRLLDVVRGPEAVAVVVVEVEE